ncbi:hypothetical protein D6850_08605 [Roseovarius spongiae]|uniref:Sulfotransferase family protein n=1 Tax=Roseovarius spongiae TaxID=2320272 RepID=A0A3A8AV11_9RHOB|nr:hypothetical protein [Roseovarius spongiae]RKF14918.1 hypothetical protein D6850_08605 [Roseovarius spongiae]
MDIILHLGAHRTASTSFQLYMRRNRRALGAAGIAFWGPRQTRNGLLNGAISTPGTMPAARQLRRARGRIALQVYKLREAGMQRLVLSDENLIGSPRRNIRDMRLYPAAGERMARYREALGGRIARVVLSIRAQDAYWTSLLAYSIPRGGALPDSARLKRIAQEPRSWRDVITDLACALPGTELCVLPHEAFASRPERKLAAMCAMDAPPLCAAREWLNRSPRPDELRALLAERGEAPQLDAAPGDAQWTPFNPAQKAAMRESYADDIYWLRAGADGLAILTETPAEAGTVKTPALRAETRRGSRHDQGQRHLA